MQIGKWPHLRILGSGPTFIGRVLTFVCPKSPKIAFSAQGGRALRYQFFRYRYDIDTSKVWNFDTDTILILSRTWNFDTDTILILLRPEASILIRYWYPTWNAWYQGWYHSYHKNQPTLSQNSPFPLHFVRRVSAIYSSTIADTELDTTSYKIRYWY